MVDGTKALIPIQLGLPIMKFLQDDLEEPNDVQQRDCELIEVQQRRELLSEKAHIHKYKVKSIF